MVIERSALGVVEWTSTAVGLLALFALAQFLQYALTPSMMRIAGATFFNLSLLTSDAFGMVISVLLFDRKFSLQFLASGVLIIAGIVVYQMAPEPATFASRVDANGERVQAADEPLLSSSVGSDA